MSAFADRILAVFPADLDRLWIAVDPDDVLLDDVWSSDCNYFNYFCGEPFR